MKIVIDVSEKAYNRFCQGCRFPDEVEEAIVAITEGTLLPKGHGRLIDADRLVPDCQEDFVYYDDDEHNVFTAVGIAQIECADTIIEADKAEGSEKE